MLANLNNRLNKNLYSFFRYWGFYFSAGLFCCIKTSHRKFERYKIFD